MNKDINSQLNFVENMSDYEFNKRSKELVQTIILDQKMIEDTRMTRKNKYEELSQKMTKEIENDNLDNAARLLNKASDSYLEIIKQETKREYNLRLLKIILG